MMASQRSGAYPDSIAPLFASGTMLGLADRDLIERFVAGEGSAAEAAFAALVERHGPLVARVCRGVLRDAHAADDAFQATFLILARRAGSIRRRDSLAAWLHGVAYHVATTARVAAARRRTHETRAGRALPEPGGEPVGDDLGAVVHAELDRLPASYRMAVVLCGLQGLTQREAAEQLGWPLGTLQSRLARGRERLRVALIRRGLAPATALAATLGIIEGARAAVPAALVATTLRVALTAGAVPLAVQELARGSVRTMSLLKLKSAGAVVALVVGLVATGAGAYAYQTTRQDPAVPPTAAVSKPAGPATIPAHDGFLTVTGTVLLPDGSPAIGALVTAVTNEAANPPNSARTDDAGRFQLRSLFGNGAYVHARTTDGTDQATWQVASLAARSALANPLVIKLAPAVVHPVMVQAAGRPVAGAEVVAQGFEFQVRGWTGPDGWCPLRLPAGAKIDEVVAYHPTLGVNGIRGLRDRPASNSTRLTLLPPGPHEVRVVDVAGKPVAGLELDVAVQIGGSSWISMWTIPAAHVRTNAVGIALLPWAPRENLTRIEGYPVGFTWKVDETDIQRTPQGVTTLHARPEHPVEGRLVMPEGADPEGILITGFGFGPGNTGDIPHARARRDGTFTFYAPADHGYVLGIVDSQWACDPWTGPIIGEDAGQLSEITIPVYPATPLTVRVTRGPDRRPVADAFVEIASMKRFIWTDSGGKQQSAIGGVRTWAKTDANGVARAGVGKGEQRIRLATATWDEERTIEVTSAEPVEIDFHRPWNGRHHVTGRLMLDQARYTPSPNLLTHAWTARAENNWIPAAVESVCQPDGTLELDFDAETLTIFAADHAIRRAGVARVGLDDKTVDLAMIPMAPVYEGTLLDENNQPLANRTLRLMLKIAEFDMRLALRTAEFDVTPAQRTDAMGRFRFAGVPANVRLELSIDNPDGVPRYYLEERDRLFKPSEVRENDRVISRRVQ